MSTSAEAPQGQEQQKKDEYAKVEQQYNQVYAQVVAVLKGEANLTKGPKIAADDLSDVIDELLAEQVAEVRAKFKTDFKELMNSYTVFAKEMKKAEEDFKKTVIEKRKGFIKKAQDALAPIDGLKEYVKSFREGFGVLANGAEGVAVPSITGGPDLGGDEGEGQ